MGDKIGNKREIDFHDMNQSKIQPKRAQEILISVCVLLRDWGLEIGRLINL
jgi:hypothetical protein